MAFETSIADLVARSLFTGENAPDGKSALGQHVSKITHANVKGNEVNSPKRFLGCALDSPWADWDFFCANR
jgi:hypothetical protein